MADKIPDPENDPYLTEHVRSTLAEDGRTNELEIRVEVVGRKIFLTGTVSTEDRRDAVGTVTRELLPGFEIHNQTAVGELTPATEAEDLP